MLNHFYLCHFILHLKEGTKEGDGIVARSKSGGGALAEAEAEAGAAKQGHIEETKIGCL